MNDIGFSKEENTKRERKTKKNYRKENGFFFLLQILANMVEDITHYSLQFAHLLFSLQRC